MVVGVVVAAATGGGGEVSRISMISDIAGKQTRICLNPEYRTASKCNRRKSSKRTSLFQCNWHGQLHLLYRYLSTVKSIKERLVPCPVAYPVTVLAIP